MPNMPAVQSDTTDIRRHSEDPAACEAQRGLDLMAILQSIFKGMRKIHDIRGKNCQTNRACRTTCFSLFPMLLLHQVSLASSLMMPHPHFQF